MTIDWSASGADGEALRVNAISERQLLADLATRLRRGQGFAIATLNLDHLVKLRGNADFARAYQVHSHVTADGNPVVWLSRLAGRRVDLIPGSDLILPVARLAVEEGKGVALLGATEAALAAAGQGLQRQVPGLRILAQIAPSMGFDPDGPAAEPVIEALEASGARICFLALGAPKQEIFAARASARLPQMGFVSIGAGLDFLAGTQRRAPALMRHMAAEWLWRMAGNPRRLAGRYARCFAVLPGEAQRALRARFRG